MTELNVIHISEDPFEDPAEDRADDRAEDPAHDTVNESDDWSDDTGGGAVREACPTWCVTEAPEDGAHTHASADTRIETLAHPLSVQLVQVDGAQPRLLIDGQVASVEQAKSFAGAIKRLTDAATLAEPGLGFVMRLATASGATVEEMALASGLDVSRLRKQRAGGQVLTLAELDRLALAVAGLASARDRS